MKKIIFNSLRKNKINIDEDLFYYGWSVSVNYLLYVIMTLAVSLYFHCFYNTEYYGVARPLHTVK